MPALVFLPQVAQNDSWVVLLSRVSPFECVVDALSCPLRLEKATVSVLLALLALSIHLIVGVTS